MAAGGDRKQCGCGHDRFRVYGPDQFQCQKCGAVWTWGKKMDVLVSR